MQNIPTHVCVRRRVINFRKAFGAASDQPNSFGRYPKVDGQRVTRISHRDLSDVINRGDESLLPRGFGRSYGASCLNANGTLLDTRCLNRVIAFDDETGILRCEAGISLDQILKLAVPLGWFLPTS